VEVSLTKKLIIMESNVIYTPGLNEIEGNFEVKKADRISEWYRTQRQEGRNDINLSMNTKNTEISQYVVDLVIKVFKLKDISKWTKITSGTKVNENEEIEKVYYKKHKMVSSAEKQAREMIKKEMDKLRYKNLSRQEKEYKVLEMLGIKRVNKPTSTSEKTSTKKAELPQHIAESIRKNVESSNEIMSLRKEMTSKEVRKNLQKQEGITYKEAVAKLNEQADAKINNRIAFKTLDKIQSSHAAANSSMSDISEELIEEVMNSNRCSRIEAIERIEEEVIRLQEIADSSADGCIYRDQYITSCDNLYIDSAWIYDIRELVFDNAL